MTQLQPIFIREQVLMAIRSFFVGRGFHEVVVPVLNTVLPVEPNLFPFRTEWNTASKKKTLFLSTSPEAGLKKMMAVGVGNCFAIGKAFRNLEGAGDRHNPEFL